MPTDKPYVEIEGYPAALVDEIIDDLPDPFGTVRHAISRGGFARVAANIAEDRYSAGSQAARVATLAYLKYGREAMRNFIADLEHHEG